MPNVVPLFAVHMPPREKLMPALETVLYSGYIGQGPVVESFEQAFGSRIGNSNVLSVNSGTSALHLAYRLAGVEGGEVITTPMTCTATNMPILANGADIVWADIHPDSGMISALDVERKITPRTRAITIVYWGGSPASMTAFYALREKYGIPLIVDAAHALGAIDEWQADYTIFSFQAIKHITTVDGGVLLVRDTDKYKQGKLLRWYGIDREGDRKDFRCEEDIKDWGYKFHMNDVTATIGLLQLEEIDAVVKLHQDNATYYNRKIKNSSVYHHFAGKSSYWLYTVLVDKRDEFMRHMRDWGVQVSRVHERNDKHTIFAPFARVLPGVDEFCATMVCIPVHSALTEDQRELVVRAVNAFGVIQQ